MEGLILSFIFYNIIVWLIYKHYKRGEYNISKKNLFYYTMLFIAFGAYGNHLGDYWRINELVEFYGNTPTFDIGRAMEKQYFLLAKLVHGNYVLWRLSISTIAFVGFAFFLKKAEMDNYPTLMLFATLCLFWTAGHRGWWGYIYYFFGIYLFFKKRNPIYLLIAGLSYFSHSSTILLLALLPVSFFRFNKYVAFALMIGLSLALGILQEGFNDIAANGMENEYYSQKIESYSSQTANNFFGSSIGEYIQSFFGLVPKYLFMFYMGKLLLFDSSFRYQMSKEQNAVTNVSFILFVVSIIAYFMDLGSGTIAYRILTMSTFPILILSQYVLVGNYEKYRPRMNLWFFLSIEFTYIFSIYYAHVHGI